MPSAGYARLGQGRNCPETSIGGELDAGAQKAERAKTGRFAAQKPFAQEDFAPENERIMSCSNNSGIFGFVGICVFRELIEKGCFRLNILILPMRIKNGNTPYIEEAI